MDGIRRVQTSDVGRKNLMDKRYDSEEFPDGKGRTRHGSPIFYALLQSMAETHDRKSHDYASNDNPFGNYHFAGMLSKLFDNPNDAGFIGRIGEKLYRLANLENSGKIPTNEAIEDTEIDICTIVTLWMASRRERRMRDTRQELIPGRVYDTSGPSGGQKFNPRG